MTGDKKGTDPKKNKKNSTLKKSGSDENSQNGSGAYPGNNPMPAPTGSDSNGLPVDQPISQQTPGKRDELRKELLLELRSLRSDFIEICKNHLGKVDKKIVRLINLIGDDEIALDAPFYPQKKDFKQLIKMVQTLPIKPEKGRLKDIQKVVHLINELDKYLENLK